MMRNLTASMVFALGFAGAAFAESYDSPMLARLSAATAVRDEASWSSKILKELKSGTEIRMVGYDGDWRRIDAPVHGWVPAGHVQPGVVRYVRDPETRVWEKAQGEGGVVKTVGLGDRVLVRTTFGEHWKFISQPVEGWVHGDKIGPDPLVKFRDAMLARADGPTLVRKWPGAEAPSKTTLPGGKELHIVAKMGEWRRLSAPADGWARSFSIQPGVVRYVKPDAANVRTGPGTDFGIKKSLKRGDRVLARAVRGNWREISQPVNGWMHEDTLVTDKPQTGSGGSGDFQTWMLNGHPGNVTTAVKAAIARAVRAGLVVTSTTDGVHASGSYHYSGRAVDIAGSWSAMVSFQRSEAARGYGNYLELFGPDSWYLKYGVRYGGAFPAHGDHVHVALR